ncbi:uncharacterized protein LOC134672849 [Cydia fagiglandana]|uniref:uncharacterized protein LOC134672849 n=1 Tax=Cydia fagiglandana TaxID=1458189 RepID=UPI002FEDFA0C
MDLVVVCALVGLVCGKSVESQLDLDYHNHVGIPTAKRIKAHELEMHQSIRITGGALARIGQYPFFGGILITMIDNSQSVCGSTLLSNTRAVTAAHCWRTNFSQAKLFTVIYDSIFLFSGGTRVSTSDVEVHEDYNASTISNDIAIIKHAWVDFNTAHCWRTNFSQAKLFTVIYDSIFLFSGGTRVSTSDVEVHEDYNASTISNDIAIIKHAWGGILITMIDNSQSVCGSTLLSNTRAVTAAHCWRTNFSQAKLFTVIYDSIFLFSGGTRVSTSDVEVHEDYNASTISNDIAIIKHAWGGILITMIDHSQSVCGSTLLSNTRAVTAAHCWRTNFSQAKLFTVIYDSIFLFSGGTRVSTSDVEVHEDYNASTISNDTRIAIIKHAWVDFNSAIHSIPIAIGEDSYVGQWAQAVGFGRTSDSPIIPHDRFLSHVFVPVITNEECKLTYGPIVLTSTLCVATTGGRSTCSGDSGGPLVVNNKLIGVTSFGHAGDCTRGYPTGFTRVNCFAAWINDRL